MQVYIILSPKEIPKKSMKTSSPPPTTVITSDPNYDPALDLKLLDLNDDLVSSTPKNNLAQLLAIRV